ncbi:hypothetical protein GWI33_018790 [Rhynchophorus ferrugineus]|uniref:SIFamide n=2 Tax=Rhynchophorus ferrugineus TaxID=354439 RepID=A0A834M259_RHYFE|nr:hypothetical protein GWI33_018790 [Rhynchophorus ferrugineus]
MDFGLYISHSLRLVTHQSCIIAQSRTNPSISSIMVQSMATKMTVLLLVATFLFIISPSEGTYRKPPFNGSIFGKRSGLSSNDYDSASKAMSAMCEIANEACQSWFPLQEK